MNPDFDISEYKDSDYELYKKMHKVNNAKTPPKSALPPIGFVVGDYKLIGFLANTDCDFMIATWYVTDKDLPPRAKYDALRQYFLACKETARLLNKKHLFVYSNYSGIIKLLESLQFYQIEQGHLIAEVI